MVIPNTIYERLGAYKDPADQASIGKQIAIEQVQAVRRAGWSGLYLMSPATHHCVVEVLRTGLS